MKKSISIFVILCLLFSLSSCIFKKDLKEYHKEGDSFNISLQSDDDCFECNIEILDIAKEYFVVKFTSIQIMDDMATVVYAKGPNEGLYSKIVIGDKEYTPQDAAHMVYPVSVIKIPLNEQDCTMKVYFDEEYIPDKYDSIRVYITLGTPDTAHKNSIGIHFYYY